MISIFNVQLSVSAKLEGCENADWVGDGYCDDMTNNKECNFDGGDCCGPNVNRRYCIVCQCYKPCKIGNKELDHEDFDGCSSEEEVENTENMFSGEGCLNPSLVGDGYCDDATNTFNCNYDGGDCCGSYINTEYCSECQCLEMGGSGILERTGN